LGQRHAGRAGAAPRDVVFGCGARNVGRATRNVARGTRNIARGVSRARSLPVAPAVSPSRPQSPRRAGGVTRRGRGHSARAGSLGVDRVTPRGLGQRHAGRAGAAPRDVVFGCGARNVGRGGFSAARPGRRRAPRCPPRDVRPAMSAPRRPPCDIGQPPSADRGPYLFE
jgi:hypothetical protein